MATKRQAGNSAQRGASQAAHAATRSAGSLKDFVKKIQNDWATHLAQALAFSLLTALLPIMVLLIGIFGVFLGTLDKSASGKLIDHISTALKGTPLSSHDVLQSAFDKLSSSSGLLIFIAIVVALIFGSRLFVLMEMCFDVIYRLQPRPSLQRNLIAVGMLILFTIFIPFLVLASTVPGVVLSILQNTPIGDNNAVTTIFGILSSLIVSFLLFEAFYVFIPNRAENARSIKHRFRTSWKGAAVAAIVLQLMLLFFPTYTRLFTKGYVGQVGLVLAVVAFFYLFALIILLGAEVNAFFEEGIQPATSDLISRASRNV
ncbi:MAG: YihY/virulence factor BrkB family protein [Ktedonobacteraceae bacterium]